MSYGVYKKYLPNLWERVYSPEKVKEKANYCTLECLSTAREKVKRTKIPFRISAQIYSTSLIGEIADYFRANPVPTSECTFSEGYAKIPY